MWSFCDTSLAVHSIPTLLLRQRCRANINVPNRANLIRLALVAMLLPSHSQNEPGHAIGGIDIRVVSIATESEFPLRVPDNQTVSVSIWSVLDDGGYSPRIEAALRKSSELVRLSRADREEFRSSAR
jgi:hypothetical protein